MAELQVQKAVVLALRAGLPVPVYTDPPDQGPAFSPFVHVEAIDSVDWSTKTEPGFDMTLTVNAYSRGTSVMGASTHAHHLKDQIYHALHDQTLSLDNGANVLTRFSSYALLTAGDGVTRQANIRFRILVQ